MPDVNKVDVQNAKNSRKESESKSTRVSQKVENLDKVDASAKDTCGANELTCRYKFVLTFVLYFCHFFYVSSCPSVSFCATQRRKSFSAMLLIKCDNHSSCRQ